MAVGESDGHMLNMVVTVPQPPLLNPSLLNPSALGRYDDDLGLSNAQDSIRGVWGDDVRLLSVTVIKFRFCYYISDF